jgi:membrane protein YdbS with pleckstrin-like domain
MRRRPGISFGTWAGGTSTVAIMLLASCLAAVWWWFLSRGKPGPTWLTGATLAVTLLALLATFTGPSTFSGM